MDNFYGLEDYSSWQIILQTPIAKSAANQIFNSRLYDILNIRTYPYFGCFILHLISGFFVIQPIWHHIRQDTTWFRCNIDV